MSTRIRITLGILLLFVSIGIGYLLYRLFFAPVLPGRTETPTTERGTASEFPSSNLDDRTNIVSETATPVLPISDLAPVVGTNDVDLQNPIRRITDTVINLDQHGAVNYYSQNDGHFYTLDSKGVPTQLSDEVFFNVSNITWSTNGNTAIIEYPDGANTIYDFSTKKQTTLPRHWDDFSFTDNGNTIVAKSLGVSDANHWLVSVKTDGTNVTLIEPLGQNADKVIVSGSPNNQYIAFSRTGDPISADTQEILLVGKNKENFKSLIVEGRDFRPTWSETGDKLVYSVYSNRSDYKPELWVVDASPNSIGSNRKFLNINTWANKCSFGSSDT